MGEIEQLKKQKDGAYWERNQLVAALSKLFPAHLAKHPKDDKEWDDDWRTIVVIQLPLDDCNKPFHRGYEVVHTLMNSERDRVIAAGEVMQSHHDFPYYQLSWHIHDSDISLFDHLKYDEYDWDGHSNEEKYRRLRHIKPINTNRYTV